MANPHLFSFQWHSADSVPSAQPKTLTHAQEKHTRAFQCMHIAEQHTANHTHTVYTSRCTLPHTHTDHVHTSAVYHVQALSALSRVFSLT